MRNARNPINFERSEADAIAEIAREGIEPKAIPAIDNEFEATFAAPLLLKPDGSLVSTSDHLLRQPVVTDNRTLVSVASFSAYVNKFKDERTALFADRDDAQVHAIFDFDLPNAPGTKRHKATLALKQTTAMKTWRSNVGKKMSQVEFAMFLEDNALDVQAPASLALIEAAKGFRAKKDVEFDSRVSLDDGSIVFAYSETVRGQTNAGQLALPEFFSLALTPFEGMPTQAAFKLDARIRYSVSQHGIQFWYAIPMLERMMEQAFGEAVEAIKAATNIEPFQQ